MKIKVAKYIENFIVENGITDVFTVTGGGAMHLNDAFGNSERLHCIYNHHEQACAIAAEAYARLSGRIAAVCVTSGPGGTNAITGVLGAWLDSIPMLVISGQVKRETTVWATDVPLRQLGDQEYDIIASVSPMTKYAEMITDPTKIRYHLEKAFFLAKNGRPGPVWLDIPLDVQGAVVETDDLIGLDTAELESTITPKLDEITIDRILDKLSKAKRPVLLAGTGIRISGAYDEFLSAIEKLSIPVVTEWNGNDLLWDSHRLYCGRPGTIGTRGGNFVVQNSDLLLAIGCRMNIRLISYNYRDFAKNAYKIIVDVDKNELMKPTITADMPVWADAADLLQAVNKSDYMPQESEAQQRWLKWSRDINQKYPAVLRSYYKKKTPVNPYAFINELTHALDNSDRLICGNGSACVVTFQAAEIKKGQRMFTNSGCAAMGYGFPAAIGCCIAERGKRIICIDGDGSFQMNIQELQTVVYNKLNIKIFYLNNNGYHSIRQTQRNLFAGHYVGICKENGISFPDIEKIAFAYGIKFVRIDNVDTADNKIDEVLSSEGAVICEVVLDTDQNFEPKLSSKVLPDGKMVSPPIDDMFPFLDKEEYERNKDVTSI